MKKKTWIIILTLIILGFCIYSTSAQPVFLPKGSGIPDREIVFSFYDDEGHHIGFINADGSGLETRQVKFPAIRFRPLRFNRGTHEAILWNETGDSIGMLQYFDYAPVLGIPFLIDNNGNFLFCSESSSPIGIGGGEGRLEMVGDNTIITVMNSSNEYVITAYDMETCQEIDEFYRAEEGEYLYHAAISKTNWIALSHSVNNENQFTVMSPDKTTQYTIDGANHPSWSKNGEYLAFVKKDGLYIISRNGERTEKIMDNVIECSPSWSPDGDQLVVELFANDQSNIAIVDVTTGEITTIFEGGRFPDWR